jgi:signal transduction histidine kinase
MPITVNEAAIGAVEATSPASAVASRTHDSWVAMVLLGLVALAAAAVIAIWQARRLARPVDALAAAAGRLGDGDFDVPAAASGIAELDRATIALQTTASRLGELMARERAFTANANHQLRTPLTALRLSLENVLETPGVDAAAGVRDAVAEVDRLSTTLEQLVAMARTGETPVRQAPLGDILDSLEQRWHPVLAQRGRPLRVETQDLTSTRGVPAALAQILDILVDNAATHGRGSVGVTAAPAAGGMTIDVTDEGEGLLAGKPDLRDDGAGGHGIGLPLARSLAEAAGGRLVVKRIGAHPVVAVILP